MGGGIYVRCRRVLRANSKTKSQERGTILEKEPKIFSVAGI